MLGCYQLGGTAVLPCATQVTFSATLRRCVPSYLMDKHIDRFVQWHSLSVGHGQEPETHADVEPFTHADPVERL